MGNTNHIRGRNCSFKMYDLSGTAFTLTGDGNSLTLSYSAALLDTSTYGDDTVTNFPDIKDYTVSFSGFADLRGAQSACKLAEMVAASAGGTFVAAPAGSLPCACGACPSYSGCVHIENLDLDFPADNMCTYSFTLRPRTGSLTFSSGSWT